MQMLEMLYDEIKDAVDRKVPFIIPIGTLEYHARHASCNRWYARKAPIAYR